MRNKQLVSYIRKYDLKEDAVIHVSEFKYSTSVFKLLITESFDPRYLITFKISTFFLPNRISLLKP